MFAKHMFVVFSAQRYKKYFKYASEMIYFIINKNNLCYTTYNTPKKKTAVAAFLFLALLFH